MPSLAGKDYLGTFIAIDPAGSDNENADCTAMVAGSVFGHGDEMKIYIHQNPVNRRMIFNETKELAMLLSKTIGGSYPATLVVEDVALQKWLIQELRRAGLPVEEFKVGGVDKHTRLSLAGASMQSGMVFFPKKEFSEDLRQQLIGFGLEKYDDLADAFSALVLKIRDKYGGGGSFFFQEGDGPDFNSFSSTPKNPEPVPKPPPKEELNKQADRECIRKSEFERSDGAKQ